MQQKFQERFVLILSLMYNHNEKVNTIVLLANERTHLSRFSSTITKDCW